MSAATAKAGRGSWSRRRTWEELRRDLFSGHGMFAVAAITGPGRPLGVGRREEVLVSGLGATRDPRSEKAQRARPLDGGGPGVDAKLHIGVTKVGLHSVEREVQVRCHV